MDFHTVDTCSLLRGHRDYFVPHLGFAFGLGSNCSPGYFWMRIAYIVISCCSTGNLATFHFPILGHANNLSRHVRIDDELFVNLPIYPYQTMLTGISSQILDYLYLFPL